MEPPVTAETSLVSSVTFVVAGLGGFVSALVVRHLCLSFTLDPGPYEPSGYDYRTTAVGLVTAVLALAALTVVTCLGRGARRWVVVVLGVLIAVLLALALHDAVVAGQQADDGDSGLAFTGFGLILLLAPTSWPLLLVVLVRPLTFLRSSPRAGELRATSYPAPR